MIRLGTRPSTPASLTSPKVEETKNQIAKKIESGITVQSKDFKPHWGEDDIKESLYRFQNGKCCYCERKRDMKRESDVEHFRPKAGINGEEDHPGYWWLAYEWENYFLSCKSCNQEYKKNHFPLLPGGERAFTEESDLALEKPVLLHPVDDDPEKFIGFDWQEGYGLMVKAIGLDKEGRGFRTASDLTAINKRKVMEQRAELVVFLQSIVKIINHAQFSNNDDLKNKYYNIIKTETTSDKEYAGFRRVFFRAAGLGEFVSEN